MNNSRHAKAFNAGASSLVLGTAQLGMTYGVANKTGQPNQATANAIVAEAWRHGINEFDAAQGYGNCESVLGQALDNLGVTNKARIITKLDPKIDHSNQFQINHALQHSLTKLGATHIHGLLIHKEEYLELWQDSLSKIMRGLVESGKVKHVGISVYSPEKALKAIETEGIDIVQLPTNIFDRRFERAGIFKLAYQLNKQIYIRSIYLQGLLLINHHTISDGMKHVQPLLEKLDELARAQGLNRKALALGYVKAQMPGCKIIFGADVPIHVTENYKLFMNTLSPEIVTLIQNTFNEVDERIVDPRQW